MKPAEFWHYDLTPYETALWARKQTKRDIVMAWNIAALNRAGKTKHFPKSPDLLTGEKTKRKMSSQQMFETMKLFAAKHNASDLGKRKPAKPKKKKV